MSSKLLFVPLALFLLLSLAFTMQLTCSAHGDDPTRLESALIGKPLPAMTLASLANPSKTYDQALLRDGRPWLLNVWATWCPTCRAEHQFLNGLAARGVRILGINYKDSRQQALAWLNMLRNPYTLNVIDGDGMLGLDLGVYGAPETFLIDGQGIVRYRHAGDMNDRVWRAGGCAALSPVWREEKMMRAAILVLLGGLLLSAYAAAAVDIHQFSSVAQEQQYRELIGELRCPKCQNTSIADSNAVIAGDIRDKVYHLMLQGQSKQQIIDYMAGDPGIR